MGWLAQDKDPEWPFDLFATEFQLDPSTTALLVIDMQGSDDKLNPNSELGRKYPQIVSYWNQRITDTVVPNIIRLLEYFCSINSRVVYTRNRQIKPNGAEVTARLRRWEPDPVPNGFLSSKGSELRTTRDDEKQCRGMALRLQRGTDRIKIARTCTTLPHLRA